MKRVGIILLFVLMMMMQWEYQRSEAAILLADGIPAEAIRMRILAHSDHPQDQWLKQQVRDEVIALVTSWDLEWSGLEEARNQVTQQLAEIEAVVATTIAQYGFDYPFSVSLAEVPFPDKLYGDRYYPAGEYEAVRIVLGEGKGENWWCVLFPPLCFVDVTTVETVPAQEGEGVGTRGTEVEFRFFLIEWIQGLIQLLKGFLS